MRGDASALTVLLGDCDPGVVAKVDGRAAWLRGFDLSLPAFCLKVDAATGVVSCFGRSVVPDGCKLHVSRVAVDGQRLFDASAYPAAKYSSDAKVWPRPPPLPPLPPRSPPPPLSQGTRCTMRPVCLCVYACVSELGCVSLV